MTELNTIPDYPCVMQGRLGSVRDATVSVLDRGFIFGDGVYDVAPAYDGRLFRFDEHIARLSRSLAKIRIPNPHTRDEWLALCRRLVNALDERGMGRDAVIYLQVTRGVAVRDHVMPTSVVPTVFAMASPLKAPSAEQRHQGVRCVTARDFRWERGDIKSVSLLGAVLARQISADQDAAETVMFRETAPGQRWLTEAAASNVWVVHEGAVLGPPKNEHVLEGIRYELIRELCQEEGLAFNLRPISESEVLSADELMLSSATKEVLPITSLDGQPVGHGSMKGRPGPIYARLHEAYQRAKREQSI
jgi:D-alanine transaminase